ncbi:hypothetical protein BRADI_3g50090v3, partial [Brachypodium distachyon]
MRLPGSSSCFLVIMLVLFTVFSLRAAPTAAQGATDTFIYAGCSPSKYEPHTAFESNLNSLLTSIASSSARATYNSFSSGAGSGSNAQSESQPQAASGAGAGPRTAAYGLYQCRGDLSPGDCAACVQRTVARLGAVCANAYAAALQADGCYVRYDADDFVGRADNTAVAYRRCGSGSSDDGAFLRSREGVLRQLQLQAAARGYKVITSGAVQGVAQCLGDIAAPGGCGACLAQAVAQLKDACGSALAADVYLEQCYVKYWADGHDFRSSQDYSGDEFGRTVAIIIGILAGLALLVIFISFLTKA